MNAALARIGVTAAIALAAAAASVALGATTASAEALAIVVQDQVSLRAAPRDSAPQQAALTRGDLLEIRGERLDHLQVYDHRRERAGYVRSALVRRVELDAAHAPQLLAIVRFLRDTPGEEALGIAYAAAYLKGAPVEQIDAEPFDALGTMAERLARRASARQGKTGDALLASHLEGVAAYGVTLTSFERDGRVRLCYDGDAFRRVLTLQATPEQRARAALALTRDDCIDPAMPPLQRLQLDEAHADLLERIDLAALPETLRNRVRLRRASVWSALVYERSRQPDGDTRVAAEHALLALAGVDKNALADEDQALYSDAAVRFNASRWAAEPRPALRQRLAVLTEAGQPGQTCVLLVDRERPAKPLAERCTYGTVWPQSASVNAAGSALALAVQPLATWRELWLFHRTPQGWSVDVLPPANGDPQLGVIEFAGWVPDGKHLLAAREAQVDGRFRRSFELVRIADLASEKRAEQPQALSIFYRWQDAAWKRQSPILR